MEKHDVRSYVVEKSPTSTLFSSHKAAPLVLRAADVCLIGCVHLDIGR